MRAVIWIWLLFWLLGGQALAVELPEKVTDAVPKGAEALLEEGEFSTSEGFLRTFRAIGEQAAGKAGEILRQRLRGAASVLLVVVLCGVIENFWQGAAGEKGPALLSMAGAVTITLLTAGDLESLLGLGRQTIGELSQFSGVLLPVLAAVTAAAGYPGTATVQQAAAVLLVDLMIAFIQELLLPMVYLYIGVLTASCALSEERLGGLAAGMKRVIVWGLTIPLLGFTLYLSAARVITGAVDAASVRVTKAALSGMVPVVGGIISEAAETVLAGAGVLKNTIGIFGTLAVLAACALPFLHLGIQYLLYKLTAFLAAAMGASGLCKLIDGLGGAFGLILGMTGSCAILLLISVLSSVAAVMPG